MLLRIAVASTTVLVLAFAAFLGVETFKGANAVAYPVAPADADVNGDGVINSIDLGSVAHNYGLVVGTAPRPVAEQNLDGNGNIKVHEQGTVNVNVVSQTPASVPRLIPLVITDANVTDATKPFTDYVDVRGCHQLDLFAVISGAQNGGAQANVYPSLDGTTSFPPLIPAGNGNLGLPTRLNWNTAAVTIFAAVAASPFVRIGASQYPATGLSIVSASLYCS